MSYKFYYQNFLLSSVLQTLSSIYVYARFKEIYHLSPTMPSCKAHIYQNTNFTSILFQGYNQETMAEQF